MTGQATRFTFTVLTECLYLKATNSQMSPIENKAETVTANE
jgi:hypothetical protein